jgi:hypothetical protein
LLFASTTLSNKYFRVFFNDGFMPAPTSIGAIKIWGFTWQLLLQYIGYPSQWTIFITALIAVSVVDTIRNRCLDSFIFIATIVVALVASALHLYPLVSSRAINFAMSYGRTSLFLVPLLYSLIVRGLQILAEQGWPSISWLLTTVLLIPSLSSALILLSPIVREEVRPALHYLSQHQMSNDHVYVYYRNPHSVKYYQRYVQLPEQNVHWGKSSIRDQPQFSEEIASMKQWPRVWFLFSHRYEDEEIVFLSNIKGKLLDQYHAPGVSLYLYNFEHR